MRINISKMSNENYNILNITILKYPLHLSQHVSKSFKPIVMRLQTLIDSLLAEILYNLIGHPTNILLSYAAILILYVTC